MERGSWLSLAGMAVLTVLAGASAWRLQQENVELRAQLLSAELEVDALKRARAERSAERQTRRQEQRRSALAGGGRGGGGRSGGGSRAASRGDIGGGGAAVARLGGDGGVVEMDATTGERVAALRAERQEKRTAVVLDEVEAYAAEHDFDEETTASLVDIMARSMEQGADLRSARSSGELTGDVAYDELAATREATQDEVLDLLGEAEGAAFLHQVQNARARSFLGGMP